MAVVLLCPARLAAQAVEQVVVTAGARSDARAVEPDAVNMSGTLTVAQSLNENVPSVFLSDTESNPFQADIYYRGFNASAVLGSAEGLAVYQNGDRINEAFGDTVLWDVVPLFAVSRIEVLPGSDPVLGLNALGGAVALDMKTGFDWQGEEAGVEGGSFGRAKLEAQFARQWGDGALYVGASAMHDDGWRRASPSNVVQTYADWSQHVGRGSAGLSVSFAADKLAENAAVPVQDGETAAFSTPDAAYDRVVFLQGRGGYDAGQGLSLHGDAFLRATHIETLNGQASGFAPCASAPATLCSDDAPLSTLQNSAVPASRIGNGTIGIGTTDTILYGVTAQLDWSGQLLGFDNDATFGATFDRAPTDFDSTTDLGVLALQLGGMSVASDKLALGGAQFNIRLRTMNTDTGVYGENTLAITPAVSLKLAGRFNFDTIALTDRFGTSLNGSHSYAGFNPSAKLSWQMGAGAGVYAEIGQSSRTPTAAELSCANSNQPCLFPLGFISDPGLQQVTARTIELGAKGNFDASGISFDWLAALYDTRNANDIVFVSAGPFIGSGFFTNVGDTDRRGAEAGLKAAWRDFDASLNYGFVNATFRTAFAELSRNNPRANADGLIFVKPGDALPNVPRNTFNLALGWQALTSLHLKIEMVGASTQFLRGDEANLDSPLSGYAVFNAEAEYRLTDIVTLSIEGENIFDRRYATFGLYGDPTANGALAQFTNPRLTVPGQPFGVWGGVKAYW